MKTCTACLLSKSLTALGFVEKLGIEPFIAYLDRTKRAHLKVL